MILFLFALLFVQAIAGSYEDNTDKILDAFIKNNGGKSIAISSFSYPYQLVLGILTTTIDIGFANGQLNFNSFSRSGDVDVDSNQGMTFTAQIDAKLSFAYDFRTSVPATWATGKAEVDWKAPVSMKVTVDENNKASLESIKLLPTGILVANIVPYVAGRTATLYPKGDSTFASALFNPLQGYLRREFINIPF